MTHFLRKMAAAWIILGSVSVGFAQQQMPPIPTDPNVRIGKLDNGLTYYIRHNELPEKRADFYIAQKVGSILEEDNQRGLAHFLEHMCFNGTKNFPDKTLIQYLESIGVKFGENLNAYTSIDETVYNISNVPVIRDGVVDSCLLILHDWADDLTLDPKEIDSERGVIHEEWRTSTNAMMRMYEKALPTLYPESKYAYRLPIGIMEVVDNFPYQALRDYYEKWYRPDQQGIVVVGDIDVDKIEAKIKKIFSPIKMPDNPAEREYFQVPDNKETIVAIETDKEQANPVAYLYYKHEAIPNEQKGNMDYLVVNYMKSMIENMLNARHNELPEKRADFYIAQKVGSILEEDNQRGLAHFLEHMCFNGTKNFPDKTLIQYLESIGVKFGENLNAYTSIDETVYNISNVPVIRDGVVDSCLLILHDWADDLTLDPKEIDSERGVIHEEWRTSTNAMMRMYEKALPTLYPESKYAYRLPIGIMEVVDNFPYQALRDYYEKWYRPDQQGIVVVGDIDVDKIEAKIKKIFSPIKMPDNPAEREYFQVPDNKETIVAIETDKEQANPVAYLYYKHEAIPNEQKGNMDYLVVNYMKSMIENMLNARLNELTQTANPPFIFAQVSDQEFLISKTKDAFTGIVASKEDGIDSAITAIVREIERVHKFGFTASEYARAKADYLRMLESAYNERNKVKNGAYVDEYVRHFIDNEPIPGIENEYAIMNQIVPNLSVEMVNSLIPALVTDSNLVVNVFFPEKEGLKVPSKEKILAAVNKVKAETLTAYEDKVSDEPLISEKPQGGKITKQENGPFGSTILTLSNGVRVILKSTDFKADEIRMRAFSPGGSSLFPNDEIININVMNDVASIGGLGNFSNVDLEKVLAGKKASVSASVGGNTEGLSGSCSPKDFETLMQLVYLSFTAPRMDNDAFTSFKNRLQASLANQEANPMTALQDTLQKALYMGHPRTIRMKADMVDKIDYAKVMEMYKDRFKDASDFTFIFVGNIKPEEVEPLIATYLGALPSVNRKETFRDNHIDMRQGDYKNIFSKKLETPKASVLVINNGKCAYTLKNQIMMSMLSQILNIMYTESVREKEGGTYGVSAFGSLTKYPKEKAVLQIYFDTDPAKRAKMTDIILNELNQFVDQGPSAENLNKVKEFMLKKYKENAKENSYWVNILGEYFWEGTDMNTGYTNTVNSITAKDLQEFTKALLEQNNRVEVSMTSEETK